jgi:hypothetical protein
VAVIQRVGEEPVRRTLAAALVRFQSDSGEYVLRNVFRYVIATVP